MEFTPETDKFKSCYLSPSESLTPSPRGAKETPRQQLSASLKERLKRSRRSFTSPLSVAKRLCVDEEDDKHAVERSQGRVNRPPLFTQFLDENISKVRPGSAGFSGTIPEATNTPSKDFTQHRDKLSREVKDKTETLRRLKMVQMYRSKNDLSELQTLIDKWRSCAQAALYELQSSVPIDGRKVSLSELIDLFGLDDTILNFDRTEEDFSS